MILREKHDSKDFIKYYTDLLDASDIRKGNSSYDSYYSSIYLENQTQLSNNVKVFDFLFINYKDDVNCSIKISSNDNKILDLKCSCLKFKYSHSCYHLATILNRYYDTIFTIFEDKDYISNMFLKRHLYSDSNIKKELKLDINLFLKIEYEERDPVYNTLLKVRIGDTKLYLLNNKFNTFYDAFKSDRYSCKFGKELEYNNNYYYLNNKNIKIIEYLKDYFDSVKFYNENMISFSLKRLLSDKECYPISINNHVISYYKEDFPVSSTLVTQGDYYNINFDVNDLYPIYDTNFFYKDGELYRLNDKQSKFINDLLDNDINELKISKDKKDDFTNGILKIVKENITVSEELANDIIICSKPEVSLFFDINKLVSCRVELNYNGKITNYFDKNDNIVRDVDYENSVISDIQSYGFSLQNKKLILEGLDNIVNFLESGIKDISEQYRVFTSEKLKNVNIRNKTNVSSTFSIGADNIISYEFDLDGIRSDELVNIFKEIKNKKKYYRLKNGDILNLEDENILELENIHDEMEINDDDIINGKGSILKYRALYLDSLNNSKYKHTSVDSLFNNFIDNFYKSKNAVITVENMDVLRDYQRVGVKWLYNIYKTGFGGILADEMGLGKTIQSIYFIKQVLKDKPDAKVLIVVPTALVYNWSHEFEMFGSEIKVSLLSCLKNKRHDILSKSDASVFVTSYGLLREDEKYYCEKYFEVMIIDEAQTIKNFSSGITKVVKNIKSNVKIALTGTPVENSPFELWSIFDYIMPGYLGSIVKFKNKYRIKDFNDQTNILLKGLSNQIKPFILRRKKTDVIKELPNKNVNNIYIDLTEKQKIIYAAESEKVKLEIEKSNYNDIRFKILQLLMRLRQICIDPAIIYENYDGGSNKIDMLLLLLKEKMANNSKTLVFTSFRTPISIISKRLKKDNIDFYIIDGSISSLERNKRVNEFNERSTPAVFLITLKSGGVGLNLASANTVIHLDLWWNPQVENQATDRAHRIGQKNVVEVIHLICKGTIEEKILELQNKKLELSKKLIDNDLKDKDVLSSLSEKEIRELLSFENSY